MAGSGRGRRRCTGVWSCDHRRPRILSPVARQPAVWRGAYHVHSTQSDGSGTPEAIAAAAAAANLDFVILTDHGDGTRTPARPRIVDGVLLIDAVEISTDDGHYVALDLPPAPYPLAGEGRAVAEDVRRLGGMGLLAHPDSPRSSLAWHDPSVAADGFEWINGDSTWRTASTTQLLTRLLAYPLNRAGTLVGLARVSSRPFCRTRPTVARTAAGAGSRRRARTHRMAAKRRPDRRRPNAGRVPLVSRELRHVRRGHAVGGRHAVCGRAPRRRRGAGCDSTPRHVECGVQHGRSCLAVLRPARARDDGESWPRRPWRGYRGGQEQRPGWREHPRTTQRPCVPGDASGRVVRTAARRRTRIRLSRRTVVAGTTRLAGATRGHQCRARAQPG